MKTMKTIYLYNKKLQYESLDELKNEFEKRLISIGDNCELGSYCKLGSGCELGDNCVIGDDCELGSYCKLGSYCVIGDNCEFGDNCKLGSGCELGSYCELGSGCELGDNCKLGYSCKLGDNCELGYSCKLGDNCKLGNKKHPIHIFEANNEYKYKAVLFFDKNSKKYFIQLGCYTRSIEEWDNDFWNNPNSFPNDGSNKSERRKLVFERLKALSKIIN